MFQRIGKKRRTKFLSANQVEEKPDFRNLGVKDAKLVIPIPNFLTRKTFLPTSNVAKGTSRLIPSDAYLCKSGVGLATAMLELRRLDGVGDFGPSTLECPWDPVKEVRCRRTSTSLLLLWNALLLHRLLFESEFEASCFLKEPLSVSAKRNSIGLLFS